MSACIMDHIGSLSLSPPLSSVRKVAATSASLLSASKISKTNHLQLTRFSVLANARKRHWDNVGIQTIQRPWLPSPSPQPTSHSLNNFENQSLHLCQASSGNVTLQEEEGLASAATPSWAGNGPLSQFVNFLISVKPLYDLMKLGARQVLIRTAEKGGVAWRARANELLNSEALRRIKEELEDPSVTYPEYYQVAFHAYDKGNLCWEAASEVEVATLSMCRRAIPWAKSVEEASEILRSGWLGAITSHHKAFSGGLPVETILDVGCSVGVSTRILANAFPSAHVIGLDLSPYFLAVASLRSKEAEERGEGRTPPIQWLHAQGEATGLPSSSVSMVSFAFVFHECPTAAVRSLLAEAKRVLKPGGTVSMTDNSPKSKVIQNLPAPVFTLMKSTEPWSDQYYLADMEKDFADAGFTNVVTKLSDPRHRTITATA